MADIVVATLYRFAELHNLQALRVRLLTAMQSNGVRGTLLLAGEGINGTVAGAREGVDAVLECIKRQPGLEGIAPRESSAEAMPFQRTKVKLKDEIVTMGVDGLQCGDAGVKVSPQEWNALLQDDEVLLVDVRNDYETELGAFADAVQPGTASFREFPAFAERELDAHKERPIAMYCTGGIRCEKSAAYLTARGFTRVYHLHGGILNYLASVSPDESKWGGECFVFDERGVVGE